MVEPIAGEIVPWLLTFEAAHPLVFEVKPNAEYRGDLPLVSFFNQINAKIASINFIENNDGKQRSQKLQELHRHFAEELKKIALEAIENSERPESFFLVKFGRCWGRYDEQIHDLNSPEFITLFPDENDPSDLRLGSNTNELAPEQQAVIVDVYRAKTVVNIVFERREGKSRKGPPKFSNVKSLYLKELRDIGMVAVETTAGAEHARKRLQAFRESFVTREAEVVKSQHLRRLGVYCLAFGAVALIPALTSLYYGSVTTRDGWHALLIVSIMASSSAVGTWLSFSLRKVSITYGDLAGLEEDRLDPGGRVLFVMFLTIITGLIIYSDLLTISIAGTKLAFTEQTLTSDKQIIFALLIGAFAGIAERSLSGLVSKQAEDILGTPLQPQK